MPRGARTSRGPLVDSASLPHHCTDGAYRSAEPGSDVARTATDEGREVATGCGDPGATSEPHGFTTGGFGIAEARYAGNEEAHPLVSGNEHAVSR